MTKPILIGIGGILVLWGCWWILGTWDDRLLAEAHAKEAVAAQGLADSFAGGKGGTVVDSEAIEAEIKWICRELEKKGGR